MGFLPIIYKLIVTIIAIIPYIFYSHDNKSYQVCAKEITYAPIFSYIISIKSRIINQVQFSFLFCFFRFQLKSDNTHILLRWFFNIYLLSMQKNFFFFLQEKKMHSPISFYSKRNVLSKEAKKCICLYSKCLKIF